MRLTVAAMALTGGSAVAAIASLGGGLAPVLDVVSNLDPVWLAGAVGGAAFGLVVAPGRWRIVLAIVGAAGAVAAAVPIVLELTRPIHPGEAAGAACQIKLIQYNAWEHNRRGGDDAVWLADQNPDFILMEDVRPPIRQPLIARGFTFTRGVAGAGIFSRQPRTPTGFKIPPRDWPRLPSFARGAYATPCGRVELVAVHLDRPYRGDQADRVDVLASEAAHYDQRRLIIAGDFNLTPWSFGLRRLGRRLGLERRDRALFSWPATRSPIPILPIDHLYAGAAWRTVKVERGPRLGSDHYPLIAILQLGA